jgi:transposase-like protein
MVQKMTAPDRSEVTNLAAEVGVSRSSLYRWASEADTLFPIDIEQPSSILKSFQGPIRMKRPQDWTAEEKLAAVLEAASLTDEELGAFLRNRGLHEPQLQQWREQMLDGLQTPAVRKKKPPESKRIRALEKELNRKDKALAETAALLVLKKKAQEIWGDEDDDTDS